MGRRYSPAARKQERRAWSESDQARQLRRILDFKCERQGAPPCVDGHALVSLLPAVISPATSLVVYYCEDCGRPVDEGARHG